MIHLAPFCSVLALALASLAAQGPDHREAWAYAHLARLRSRVLAELSGRDLETRRKVAGLLAEDDGGIPFRGPARALAKLRSVPCDEAFLFRAMLCAFPLPEVVDPDAGNPICRNLNLSLFLPYLVPAPDTPRFQVLAVEAGGGTIFRASIDADTAPEDLRMARARCVIPCGDLPDGSYEIRIRTDFGEAGPRKADPELRCSFFVLRGYQRRAEKAMSSARDAVRGLGDLDSSLLRGLSAEVARAYYGSPYAVEPTAVEDLRLLERGLANVREHRPVLSGMTGVVAARLPIGGGREIGVSVDLPVERSERPLLLIAPATPSYRARSDRPGAPRSASPRASRALCGDLDPGHRYHVVHLESPGNGVDYGAALSRALDLLPRILPVSSRGSVLVAEREAAMAASFLLPELAERLSGVALVSGGALSSQALGRLRGIEVLLCPAQDDPASEGLFRVRDLAAGRFGPVELDWHIVLDPPDGRSWALGLPQSTAAIEALCARTRGDR
ncbi:MAG: hypothetical protein Fur0037_18970 [Planctomycetota bacterium]